LGLRGLAEPAQLDELAAALYRQLETWLLIPGSGSRGADNHGSRARSQTTRRSDRTGGRHERQP
jgi:hypothetical protein